jgi:hypothetical protein
MATRFAVAWTKGSNDTFGWNGFLVDNQTGKRHRLVNEVLFEEFQGEQTWMRCAFDTKADLTKAAQRMARRI